MASGRVGSGQPNGGDAVGSHRFQRVGDNRIHLFAFQLLYGPLLKLIRFLQCKGDNALIGSA